MKLILHAGFHKTGTTTLQNKLKANRDQLGPDVRILLNDDMPGLVGATKGFSVSRDPLDLALVRFEAARIAEQLATQPATPVILSAESLSGLIPGRDGVQDYGAAPDLMRAITEAFTEALPNAEPVLYFSTRAADTWLYSCYTQHLRASRMRLSAQEYATALAGSASHAPILDQMKAAVAPHPVIVARAEDAPGTRLGRLDMLLDLAGYPADKRDMLTSVDIANCAPTPTQVAELLRINRSDLSDQDARAARLRLNRCLS